MLFPLVVYLKRIQEEIIHECAVISEELLALQ
jgi:hypothetical protein